jgi:hypothetical protein
MTKLFCVFALTLSLVCLVLMNDPLAAGQSGAPAAPALTLSIKGSPVYATAAPVPLQAALLVVTPVWEDIEAVTEVGGQEASGQPLFLSDLTVVLGNRAMDCDSVFGAAPPAEQQDFLIVVGKTEAYLPAKGWQTTSVGAVFMTEGAEATAPTTLTLDRFSFDVMSAAPKKKFSKDNVRGNDGRLVLSQQAGTWRADVAFRTGDVTAEGQVPLTACPVVSRKKAAAAPLLGENRLRTAGRNF